MVVLSKLVCVKDFVEVVTAELVLHSIRIAGTDAVERDEMDKGNVPKPTGMTPSNTTTL